MNLELPFDDVQSSELDPYLARIDQELDTLFLEEVEGTLELLRAKDPAADAAA